MDWLLVLSFFPSSSAALRWSRQDRQRGQPRGRTKRLTKQQQVEFSLSLLLVLRGSVRVHMLSEKKDRKQMTVGSRLEAVLQKNGYAKMIRNHNEFVAAWLSSSYLVHFSMHEWRVAAAS